MFRRSLFVLMILIAVFVVACGGGASTGGGGGTPLNVTVNNTEWKFEPSVINATAGQTINLTVLNSGTIRHTWVLPAQNIKLTIDVGQRTTRSFKAPAAAGTYEIVCDEAGHKESGMIGQLIVK